MTENRNLSDEVDLIALAKRLLEKAGYIVAASLIGALLSAVITIFVISPEYTATAKLYVMSASESAVNLADLQVGTYLASDYREVFSNWHVHEAVIQRLGLPYDYRRLSEMLHVTNPSDTRILYITVTATDPSEAKRMADAYAAVAQEFIASTMDTEMPRLFEEALQPSAPSSPSLAMNVAIGFAAGILLACSAITVCFALDDRIRDGADIERYMGLPVLGMMPQQDETAFIYPKRKG